MMIFLKKKCKRQPLSLQLAKVCLPGRITETTSNIFFPADRLYDSGEEGKISNQKTFTLICFISISHYYSFFVLQCACNLIPWEYETCSHYFLKDKFLNSPISLPFFMDIIFISLGIVYLPKTSSVLLNLNRLCHKVVSLPKLSVSCDDLLALWKTGHCASPNPAILNMLGGASCGWWH